MRWPELFKPKPPLLLNPAAETRALPEVVTVERLDRTNLLLRWRETAATTHIFRGDSPERVDFSRPIATIHNDNEVRIPDAPSARRHYFAVAFAGGRWDGRRLLTAERFVPLANAVNFRDIGGYETGDGRFVRWGKIFRSGIMSELAAADLLVLQKLGLQLICDLRTSGEAEKRPDPQLANLGIRYHHLPAQSLERSAQLRGLKAIFFNRSQLDSLMDEGYTRIMIDQNAAVIGSCFQLLAEAANYPMVIHCTAGKDRTGIVIALLLAVLGVPRETILADYTLSNKQYDRFRAGIREDIHFLQRFGITVDHVQPVILVKAGRLQHMFAHIQERYGRVEDYLIDRAGVSSNDLLRLKSQLIS